MKQILVLNGPNLNLLGTREPEKYGSKTLEEVNDTLITQALNSGLRLDCKQSNSESELIDLVHNARKNGVGFIIINAAAYTHTSIALRDALAAVQIPFIEVHITNVYSREEFRKKSYLSDIAQGVIVGLGTLGYELALEAAIKNLNGELINKPTTRPKM